MRAEPVRGDLARGLAAALERLGEAPVQGAPGHPRQVRVERLADERVGERPAPALLAHEARLEQLGQRLLAGELGHQPQVEGRAADRGDLDRAPRPLRQLGHADHDRVAHRVRERHLAGAGELEPGGRLAQRAADAEGGGQLAGEERDALRPVVDRAHELGAGCAREHARHSAAVPAESERRQRELVEVARAAQVVAQPAQAVAAREPVGAVGGDDQHPARGDRLAERREHLERGLVGPLQVVEQHERVAEPGEGAVQRLEQRRAVGLGGRLAELREQPREVAAQRPAGVEAARLRVQVRAQGGDERPVRRRAALRGGAAQDRDGGVLRERGGEHRLADPGLAGHQHDAAAARRGRREPLLQPLAAPPACRSARSPSGELTGARMPCGRNTACRHGKYGNAADGRGPRRP